MKDRNKIILLGVVSFIFITLFVVYGMNENNYRFLLSHRLPKVIALVISAITIAYSTVIFQTITNNRVLSPAIMGLDTLYVFLQTFLIFVFGSTSFIILNKELNFILSAVLMISSSLILYQVILRKKKNNILFLLLVGTVISTFFRSFSSFMQMIIDPNEFTVLQNSMFASFDNINADLLFLTLIILLIVIPFVIDDFKILDVCNLGRDTAINLGVNYDLLTKKSLIIIAILISVSTALVGPVTFLGIIVANLAKEMIKSYKHTTIVLTATFISIIFLVGGQFLVEKIFNFGTPLSVIINFIGGLYFVILLLKESRL